MKTYVIVTNDALELPVSAEIVGAEETARQLGIKLQRLRICLCKGFPAKAKYKAVIVKSRQYDDVKQHRRIYNKRYSMTHDRSAYYRRYQERKKKGANENETEQS